MTSSETGGENSSEQNFVAFCKLCYNPVDRDDETLWKQVIGWVGGPKKDSMRLREDTGAYAHDECVAKIQAGQAPDQESMFEEVTEHGEPQRADLPNGL